MKEWLTLFVYARLLLPQLQTPVTWRLGSARPAQCLSQGTQQGGNRARWEADQRRTSTNQDQTPSPQNPRSNRDEAGPLRLVEGLGGGGCAHSHITGKDGPNGLGNVGTLQFSRMSMIRSLLSQDSVLGLEEWIECKLIPGRWQSMSKGKKVENPTVCRVVFFFFNWKKKRIFFVPKDFLKRYFWNQIHL